MVSLIPYALCIHQLIQGGIDLMMPEQLYGKYRQIKSICIDCFKLFLWFSYEREIKASKKDNKRELRSLYNNIYICRA